MLLKAGRSGVTADKTSAQSVDFDTWTYVECGLHCSDTGSYEVRVNGNSTSWINNTSYDTAVYSASPITYIRLTRIYSATGIGLSGWFDDLYITYGDEIKFLGDSRVDTLALTANSSPQDWTPDTGNAWERLNQDVGYISSDTINATSLFAAGNLSHNPSTIHGVQINGHAYKSDAGAREAAMVLKSGGTTSVGTSTVLATDIQRVGKTHIVNPDTGVAFTKAGVDGMEVGVKVTA
jgi:hypothetical protein